MLHTLSFLRELTENNNRDWFEANRDEYEQCRTDFLKFSQDLLKELTVFEPDFQHLEAKDCLFRLYRDVRFSKDKRPYKNHFGAYFAPGGRKSTRAGYYFHLEPGNKSMLAGGMYAPPAEALKKIRQEIDYNSARLRSILAEPGFARYYGGLSGETLKTTPKGYAADHPDIHLIRHKDFTAIHPLDDKDIGKVKLLPTAVTIFRTLKPLNDFLNSAVE
jgi:uncharacterized protein (TIGR02453 family)